MNILGGMHGERAAREVAGWVPALARVGYAAKGIVYILIGFIAFRAATASGSPEGAQGALGTLADDGFGRIALMLIAAGLLAHVAWRLVQAFMDPEHASQDAKHIGLRVFFFISAVIHASLAWTAWQLSRGSAQQDGGEGIWVQRLLEVPAGRWLVMAAGLGIVAYGIHQLVKAYKGDVTRRLSRQDDGIRSLGRFGVAARGIVLLPIGWFVFQAGQDYNPQAAAGTEGALDMLGRGWLLALVGAGLLAYGAFQIVKAVYRRIEPPA